MKNLVKKYESGEDITLPNGKFEYTISWTVYAYDDPWFGAKNRTLTDFKCWKRYRKHQYRSIKNARSNNC